MKKLFVLVISLFALQGCVPLPLIFGGAAIGTGVTAAKDRSLNDSVSDTKISFRLKRDFIKNGWKNLYAKITVTVTDGRVLYTGKVGSNEDMVQAVDLAWGQEGVKEVMNELQISEDSSYFDTAEYTRDIWITGKIKSRTIMNRDIKFINYTILTSRGVVYISGIARSQEELDKVASLAASVKGVKKVVVHARVH